MSDGGVMHDGARRYLTGLALLLAACSPSAEELVPEVVRALPHDSTAYTQGLVLHEGSFYESTGRYGESTLRQVEPETGDAVRLVELDEAYFGEGLARVGDRLIQLTWKENVAFVYDVGSLEVTDTLSYGTHGWGLCHDGDSLWMTTGGSFLVRRDPESFEVLETVTVTSDRGIVRELNELECVGEHVWANVFQTSRILRIDKATGEVTAEVDGSGLVPEHLRGDSDAVLNGIAWDPSTETFYVTGKLWPVMYEVRFVER